MPLPGMSLKSSAFTPILIAASYIPLSSVMSGIPKVLAQAIKTESNPLALVCAATSTHSESRVFSSMISAARSSAKFALAYPDRL